jgi:hypothetical protein
MVSSAAIPVSADRLEKSPDTFPDRLIPRASSRIHDEVGNGHDGGEALVRWDLVERPQVRIPLGCRDVAMAVVGSSPACTFRTDMRRRPISPRSLIPESIGEILPPLPELR